jgi:hypothetical protein
MLRWNRHNNLQGKPDHIKIEVSTDNITYKFAADYDNSKMGSIMTNIVLPTQIKGRYVKISPSGLSEISSAVFTLSAIEIYAFDNLVEY